MAPPRSKTNNETLGLAADDQPQFPPKPFYIPLPPYTLPHRDQPSLVLARLYLGDDNKTAYISFHPRIGCQPTDFNLDVWLPVPPRDVFHIRRVTSEEEKMLLPIDGRTYAFPLKKTWKLCVANVDKFCVEEVQERGAGVEKRGEKGHKRRGNKILTIRAA